MEPQARSNLSTVDFDLLLTDVMTIAAQTAVARRLTTGHSENRDSLDYCFFAGFLFFAE